MIYAIMIQSFEDIWYYHPTMYENKEKAQKTMRWIMDTSVAKGNTKFEWSEDMQQWRNNDINIGIEEFTLDSDL